MSLLFLESISVMPLLDVMCECFNTIIASFENWPNLTNVANANTIWARAGDIGNETSWENPLVQTMVHVADLRIYVVCVLHVFVCEWS